MRKTNWDGWSFALAALLLWRGYIQARIACDAISNLDVAKESISDEDKLVNELMAPIFEGLKNRLDFEVWYAARRAA